MSDSRFTPPTTTGAASGRDSHTGMVWAFESPSQHWAEHDARLLAYWRSRSPEERLAQAAAYRLRQHGEVAEPRVWTWRFLRQGEDW